MVRSRSSEARNFSMASLMIVVVVVVVVVVIVVVATTACNWLLEEATGSEVRTGTRRACGDVGDSMPGGIPDASERELWPESDEGNEEPAIVAGVTVV